MSIRSEKGPTRSGLHSTNPSKSTTAKAVAARGNCAGHHCGWPRSGGVTSRRTSERIPNDATGLFQRHVVYVAPVSLTRPYVVGHLLRFVADLRLERIRLPDPVLVRLPATDRRYPVTVGAGSWSRHWWGRSRTYPHPMERKVVAYIERRARPGWIAAFVHVEDSMPLFESGLQVPAGSIEVGESEVHAQINGVMPPFTRVHQAEPLSTAGSRSRMLRFSRPDRACSPNHPWATG